MRAFSLPSSPAVSQLTKFDRVTDSGTKYFGGQSDALTGTVSVKSKEDWLQLWHNRTYTGSNAGSLEAWLILRSLRTLNLVRPPPCSLLH